MSAPGPRAALAYGVRSLRRAPGLAATLLLMLGLGGGVSIPLFSLADSGVSHPAPLESPAGLSLPLRDAGIVSAPAEPPRELVDTRWQGSPPSGAFPGPRAIAEQQADGLRVLLRTVQGAAALTLLIACGNLALLLLSRAGARRHEIAMRSVLGATRGRLLAQLLTEGALLGLVGLCAGAVLATAGLALLRHSWPDGLSPWMEAAPGARATLMGLGPLALATLLFALAPAQVLRGDRLRPLLAGGARATGGLEQGRARSRLSVLATATAVTLLVGSALLVRGFGKPQTGRSPGLDPRDTLVMELGAAASGVTDPLQRAAYYEALLREVQAVPGVEAASLSSQGAWLGLGSTDLVHAMTGSPTRPGILRSTRYAAVSPEHFRALRIPVRRGRAFTAADRAGAPAVAVVSRTFANQFFPEIDPLGRHVQPGRLSLDGTWYRVVGVVEDVRPRGIGTESQPEPMLYLSSLQIPPLQAGLAVRTREPPLELASAVEHAIRRVGPAQRIARVGTMEEALARFQAPLQWLARVFGALALAAVLLAAVGLYGVIAHGVAQRTREIGIRAALGASPRSLVALVVRQGLRLTAAGVALGLMGALCLGRLLQFHLHGIDPLDPPALLGVPALLAAVALMASFAPARAAAAVQPSAALRAD